MKQTSLKWLALIFAALATHFLFSFNVLADGPDFNSMLGSEKSAEQSIGKVVKQVVQWLLYLAGASGAMGAAWGLSQLNGWFGEKRDGSEKIKIGLGVLAISGVATGIFAYFANLGS